jgi:signal transduction histidine kinase
MERETAMVTDPFTVRLWLALDQLLLALLIAALGALLGWQLGRWSARQAGRDLQAVTAVMDATVQRRDLRETLGRLVEVSVSALGARNGAVYLLEENHWALVHAVQLAEVGRLLVVPIADAISAGAEPVGVAHLTDPQGRWTALAVAPGAISAVRFGLARPGRRCGLLVLGWPSAARARQRRAALNALARYAGKVLAEFEALAQRALDVRALGVALQRQEALARAAAHDVLNRLSVTCEALEGQPGLNALALTQLRLVGRLLQDVRDPDRPLARRPVPVESLAELAASLMALHAADLPVRFEMAIAPDLPEVFGDPLELGRVLDNLLTNAVRHNVDVPALHVWLRVSGEAAGLRFEVGDDGQGFSPEAKQAATSNDWPGPGQGLGLWSCRRILAAHGGRLWIESGPGARVCFWVPAVATRPASEIP